MIYFALWYISGVIGILITQHYDCKYGFLKVRFIEGLSLSILGLLVLLFSLWVAYVEFYDYKQKSDTIS